MRLVAGRGFAVELHREEVANRGRRSGKDAAGRGAVAKKLATPWQRAIGKKLPTKVRRSGKEAAGRGAGCQVHYSAEAPRTEGFPAEVQLLKPPASSITL